MLLECQQELGSCWSGTLLALPLFTEYQQQSQREKGTLQGRLTADHTLGGGSVGYREIGHILAGLPLGAWRKPCASVREEQWLPRQRNPGGNTPPCTLGDGGAQREHALLCWVNLQSTQAQPEPGMR